MCRFQPSNDNSATSLRIICGGKSYFKLWNSEVNFLNNIKSPNHPVVTPTK